VTIGRAEPGFGNDRENFASDDSWLRTNAGGSTAETSPAAIATSRRN
jgi:hypothetical protein